MVLKWFLNVANMSPTCRDYVAITSHILFLNPMVTSAYRGLSINEDAPNTPGLNMVQFDHMRSAFQFKSPFLVCHFSLQV